jgi:hypothetical protein
MSSNRSAVIDLRLAIALLPDWDWEQRVADVNPTVVGPADLARLGHHREELRELAQANGITNLRWDPTERRLVGTYGHITFSDDLDFHTAAAELLGRAAPIVSDNTASTRDTQGNETF